MGKEEKYLIQLTVKQTYAVITTAILTVSSIFGAGVILRNKICEDQVARVRLEHTEAIKAINDDLGLKLRTAELDFKFYKGEYHKANSRLEACLKKGEFTEFMEKALSDKED